MTKTLRSFTCLALIMLTQACVSLNSVSLTQIPANRGQQVSVTKDKTVIFFMSFDNDFVDSMVEELKSKCKDGMVQGILTRDEVVDYFLMIVHKRRVTAEGYCVGQKGSNHAQL